MIVVLLIFKGRCETPHASHNVADHSRHQYEKYKSLEALSQVQFAFRFFEQGAFWFKYLKDPDKTRQLDQLIHPANTSYSYNTVHTGGIRVVWGDVAGPAVFWHQLLNLSNWKDCQQVYQKPAADVVQRDDASMLDHFEIFIIISGVENQDHVDKENQVDHAVDDFPFKVIFFSKC